VPVPEISIAHQQAFRTAAMNTTQEANEPVDPSIEQNQNGPSGQDIDEFRLIWEYSQYWRSNNSSINQSASPLGVCVYVQYAAWKFVVANQVCSSPMSPHCLHCRTICHVPIWHGRLMLSVVSAERWGFKWLMGNERGRVEEGAWKQAWASPHRCTLGCCY